MENTNQNIIYTSPSFSVTFSGGVNASNNSLEPKKIFLNNRTMVVLWNDNTRTQSTASGHDFFDPEIGFAVCLMKKMFGKKVFGKKLFKRFISQRMQVQNVEEGALLALNDWKENYRLEGKRKEETIDEDEFPF